MTRESTEWIAESAPCQKIRSRDPAVVAVPSPIGSLCIFKEISIDFVGPLPKDGVGNMFILNTVCNTTRYCELFAVEGITAVIAAHCRLEEEGRNGLMEMRRGSLGSR